MPSFSPQQLKKALTAAGFEVFRTLGDEVVLAERVRENLIMDSGVRLKALSPLEVKLVVRALKSDFPNEDEVRLFERARLVAAPAFEGGFREVATLVHPVHDPADPERTLDTFYEVVLAKNVDELEGAFAALRFALSLHKTADPPR
jgi:hypothetical protein